MGMEFFFSIAEYSLFLKSGNGNPENGLRFIERGTSMSFKNTLSTYGSVSKFFHWLISILVILLLIVGLWMSGLEKNSFRYSVYDLHKSFGLLVLFLMILRTSWMLANPKPLSMPNSKFWERIAEKSVHWIFYIALFIMPISGWVLSTASKHVPSFFGLFMLPAPFVSPNKALQDFAGDVHEVLGWFLIFLIAVHVLAALKHHFIDHDNVLKRMMPGKD